MVYLLPVFTYSLLKKNFQGKIAIIEAGRRLGGRSTKRKRKKYKNWELNHGSPHFNICNSAKDLLLQNFVEDLLKRNFIKLDDSDLIELAMNPKLDTLKDCEFYSGKNYVSSSSMSELSENIISCNNIKNQIDFYFQTLIINLEFINNKWILTSKEEINLGLTILSVQVICFYIRGQLRYSIQLIFHYA